MERSRQNTNVVQFSAALEKDDGDRQIVYHQVCSKLCAVDLRRFVSGGARPTVCIAFLRQEYNNTSTLGIADHLNAHVTSVLPFLMRMYAWA
jgi:uncharacterized protein (DUF2235 family)